MCRLSAVSGSWEPLPRVRCSRADHRCGHVPQRSRQSGERFTCKPFREGKLATAAAHCVRVDVVQSLGIVRVFSVLCVGKDH